MRTEELYCASPDCKLGPDVHKRQSTCPPVSDSTIREILAAAAREAEDWEIGGPDDKLHGRMS